MVRELSQSAKGSIKFVLNSPNTSFDFNKMARSLSDANPNGAGIAKLLEAASHINGPAQHSTSSSETRALSRSEQSRTHSARGEVTQSLKPKRRKRKDIKCEVCGRTFGDSSSARKHHRVVHLKIKEFDCEECGKSFAEKSNRSKHYIAAHLNQRAHKCDDCDKVFNFSDGLRRHRNNVHLNIRPYPCDACKTSYKQKTHLLKHRQSVHGIPIPAKKG